MITFPFNCDQKKNIYIYISLSLSLLVQQNKSCKQSNIEDAEMVMRGVICIILEREREREREFYIVVLSWGTSS